jgi:hypothetical protein
MLDMFFEDRTQGEFEVAVDVGGDVFTFANVVAVRHE